jgi:hypothetical protein
MIGNASHGEWVQCLNHERAKAANEHGCIGMHTPHRTIFIKPSWAWCIHELLSASITVWTNDTSA